MPRKRRSPKTRRAEIPADLVAFLKDEGISLSVKYFTDEATIRAAWGQLRDTILTGWIIDSPGWRPSTWWRYDAPEPRQRLDGIGTPAHEVLADAEAYEIGLPTAWVTPADVDCYGAAFEGVAVDPSDPPIFESEAAYLKRHGLFLPGELKRLTPADFEPEKIEVGGVVRVNWLEPGRGVP